MLSSSHRRKIFYTLLVPELLLFAYLSQVRSMATIGGAMLLIATGFWAFVAGAINALVACFDKQRNYVAYVVLALHIAIAGVLLGAEALDDHRRQGEEEVRLAEAKNREEQARWAGELTRLLRARRRDEARRYVQSHASLRLGPGEAFVLAICPPDGAPPDTKLLTLLHERGAPQGGDMLVEAGACPVAGFERLRALSGQPATARDGEGRTALMRALDPAMVTHLVEQGVDVNARDKAGATALMYHRTPAVTRALLAHGANVHLTDIEGRSALHYRGAEAHLADIFEVLLQAGANPNLGDAWTPLISLACQGEAHWPYKAGDILVRYGANQESKWRAISCRMRQGPIKHVLGWPGLDLNGAGGALLLKEAMLGAGQAEKVAQVLSAGANPLAKGANGESAVEACIRNYRKPTYPGHVCQLLIDAGEKFRTEPPEPRAP